MFTQAVDLVADTSIFARGQGDRQYLVYDMTYEAVKDLAMILPLPVPPNSPEDAVHFVNLEGYPEFFRDMRDGFPSPEMIFGGEPMLSVKEEPTLRVVDVGSFEASFVPTIEDFNRLDARFRLAPTVWNQLPAYHDYGFAVFKLKPGVGPRRVHPMAFSFPRRSLDRLFFPTVHVHDGKVHAEAKFDHELYCQQDSSDPLDLGGWAWAEGPASDYLDIARAQGIVEADLPCRRKVLKGNHENKDTWTGEVPNPIDFYRARESRLRQAGVKIVEVDEEGCVTCPGCTYKFPITKYREEENLWRHSCGQALSLAE